MTDTPINAPAHGPRRLIAGRYDVKRLLGRGGMGEVLLARDLVLDRDVALKQLLPELSQDGMFLERFAREARALARVRHPGVVQVHDFLPSADGAAYLVLEYVPGLSLGDELAIHGRLPWERCARLGAAVCDALEVAHAAGVVHRDVKPANILIEPSGTVRVADFGIARLTDVSATQTGMMLGTPLYMAPEVGRGRRATPSSDLYGLSAVLFEAVCGRPPFISEDDDPAGLLALHLFGDVPEPRDHAPELPAVASQILRKGLQKEPGDRFATAAEMAVALRSTLGGHPRDLDEERSPRGIVHPGGPRPPTARADLTEVASSGSTTEVQPLETIAGVPSQGSPPDDPRTVDTPRLQRRDAVGTGTRTRGRSRLRVAGLVGGLALLGATVGAIVGLTRTGDSDPPTAVALRQEAIPGASFQVPDDWNERTDRSAETANLGLRDGRTYLAPGDSGSAGLALGTTDATGNRMLPTAFLKQVSGDLPQPSAVALGGGAVALHYPDLPLVRPAGQRISVYMVPTRTGALTVACFGPRSAFAAHADRCSSLVGMVRVEAGTAFPLGPDPDYARFLTEQSLALRTARDSAQAAMRAAIDRSDQIAGVRRAEAAYRAFQTALTERVVSPQAAPVHDRLAESAGTAADAYGAVAAAGEQGSDEGWADARREALAADRRFQEAVRGMAAAGYAARER